MTDEYNGNPFGPGIPGASGPPTYGPIGGSIVYPDTPPPGGTLVDPEGNVLAYTPPIEVYNPADGELIDYGPPNPEVRPGQIVVAPPTPTTDDLPDEPEPGDPYESIPNPILPRDEEYDGPGAPGVSFPGPPVFYPSGPPLVFKPGPPPLGFVAAEPAGRGRLDVPPASVPPPLDVDAALWGLIRGLGRIFLPTGPIVLPWPFLPPSPSLPPKRPPVAPAPAYPYEYERPADPRDFPGPDPSPGFPFPLPEPALPRVEPLPYPAPPPKTRPEFPALPGPAAPAPIPRPIPRAPRLPAPAPRTPRAPFALPFPLPIPTPLFSPRSRPLPFRIPLPADAPVEVPLPFAPPGLAPPTPGPPAIGPPQVLTPPELAPPELAPERPPLTFFSPQPLQSPTQEDECDCTDRKHDDRQPSDVVAAVKGFRRRMSQYSLDNLRKGNFE